MACIEKIFSVSALVGGNNCNANCSFCAAKDLRNEACKNNQMPSTYKAAIKLSARYGGWSLSLTSSGEPTCSPEAVTNALKDYDDCAKEGAYFPNVCLFTNGILLANDSFCKKWFPIWKELGLSSIAVSIHEIDEKDQAKVYGVDEYPKYSKIFSNISKYGFQARATLLRRRGGVETLEQIKKAIAYLNQSGCENITSWCISNPDNSRNEFTPSRFNNLKLKLWLNLKCRKCHGHVWGGGVYDYKGTIFRITTYVTRHKPNQKNVRQLVVFQDGTVAYSWIKEGALCFKL